VVSIGTTEAESLFGRTDILTERVLIKQAIVGMVVIQTNSMQCFDNEAIWHAAIVGVVDVCSDGGS